MELFGAGGLVLLGALTLFLAAYGHYRTSRWPTDQAQDVQRDLVIRVRRLRLQWYRALMGFAACTMLLGLSLWSTGLLAYLLYSRLCFGGALLFLFFALMIRRRIQTTLREAAHSWQGFHAILRHKEKTRPWA